jgi:hypothetical protein
MPSVEVPYLRQGPYQLTDETIGCEQSVASRKGIPNKIGAAVKSNVVAVFDKIGGREAMANWAKENLTEFYKLYARLIPTEVVGTIDIRDASELSDSELLAIAAGSSEGTAQPETGETEPRDVH